MTKFFCSLSLAYMKYVNLFCLSAEVNIRGTQLSGNMDYPAHSVLPGKQISSLPWDKVRNTKIPLASRCT